MTMHQRALLLLLSLLSLAATSAFGMERDDDRRGRDRDERQTIVQHTNGTWAVIRAEAVEKTESRAVAVVRCDDDALKIRLRRYAGDGTWMVEDNYRFERDETELYRRISFAQSPTILRAWGEVKDGRFRIKRSEAKANDKVVTPEAWLKKPAPPVHGSSRQLPFGKLVRCERR